MTQIEVQNVLQPGKTYRVDAIRFNAMRAAFLTALPSTPPGLMVAEVKLALLPHLPQDLFPSGEKAGWWMKSVQLDLEAKGIVQRGENSPVRLWRVQ